MNRVSMFIFVLFFSMFIACTLLLLNISDTRNVNSTSTTVPDRLHIEILKVGSIVFFFMSLLFGFYSYNYEREKISANMQTTNQNLNENQLCRHPLDLGYRQEQIIMFTILREMFNHPNNNNNNTMQSTTQNQCDQLLSYDTIVNNDSNSPEELPSYENAIQKHIQTI